MDIALLGLSFLEGIGLILSPCILPILPLILATGIQGGKWRPYGIILGFISTFVLFTFFARKILSILHVNPVILQDIALYLILAFGVILFSDYLSEKFSSLFQKSADLGQKFSQKAETHLQSGFWGGVLIGSGIALIWTPCAGPIMAAVLVQTLQQKADYQAVLILTAFSMGVAFPMLIITLFSKKIIGQVRLFSQHARLVRKILASIIIITMVFTKFNVWQKIVTLAPPTPISHESLPATTLIHGLTKSYPAPSIAGIQKWINSPPLTLQDLKGRVVLVDFWTYSCINCVRTLPTLKSWHDKYQDKGLVIIGIHAPEFEFEKNEKNVEIAVNEHQIHYPVALDNTLATWSNFNNRYWPAHYLINKEGQVVYTHFGEGNYDITENNIRYLLGLGSMADDSKPALQDAATVSSLQSPETYLGYKRTQGFVSSPVIAKNKPSHYAYPNSIPLNSWALHGSWLIQGEKSIAKEPGASLKYHFRAKQVYLVMAPSLPGTSPTVKILFNGKPLTEFAGKDVKESQIVVRQSTLYELASFKELTTGIIEIQAESPNLEVFAFTFGAM